MAKVFKYLQGDKIIWQIVFGLMTVSLLIVFSSISTLAVRSHSLSYHFMKHSGLLFGGLVWIIAVHRIPYKYFSKLSIGLYVISIILLGLVYVIGRDINGAFRTISFFGISFQPSDLAKMSLIMLVARSLSRAKENVNNFKKFVLPLGARIFLICGLILPSDLSTAALLYMTVSLLMLIGRVKWYNIVYMTVIGVVTLSLAMVLLSQVTNVVRIDTWISRVEVFFNKNDAVGESQQNHQPNQSKIAVATGGPFGKGPGHSTQRNILPHPYSDYAYAIIVEEYGLFGALGILLLYFMLFSRAAVIVRNSPTFYGALLAIGLAMGLVFQGLINMGVCVGILPVTGQPLPIISMGGTSIWFSCISIGIILSVSRGTMNQNKLA